MSEWSNYFKNTQNDPPNALLLKALPYVTTGKTALDLGAGALVDAKYLAKQGFTVMAVDSAKEMLAIKLKDKEMDGAIARTDMTYAQYFKEFPDASFDLVTAQWALSFELPRHFDDLITNIRKALKPGGIFTGNIYGPKHSWAAGRASMTFMHPFDYEHYFLPPWQIIYSEEVEEDKLAAVGDMTHWHHYKFILRK